MKTRKDKKVNQSGRVFGTMTGPMENEVREPQHTLKALRKFIDSVCENCKPSEAGVLVVLCTFHAASWEMLEALKKVRNYFVGTNAKLADDKRAGMLLTDVLEAIAKAEGKIEP